MVLRKVLEKRGGFGIDDLDISTFDTQEKGERAKRARPWTLRTPRRGQHIGLQAPRRGHHMDEIRLFKCCVAICRFLAFLQNTLKRVETAPHDVVLCTRGRGERAVPRVLATRAKSALVMSYDRPKCDVLCVDFRTPCKIGRNCAARCCALRKRGLFRKRRHLSIL